MKATYLAIYNIRGGLFKMKKVTVIYWSGTGNTEKMAEAIAEGAKVEGIDVILKNVSEASSEDVFGADAVALGCPSMGAEELEDSEMEPFVESLNNDKIKGRPVVLFGSYDWGDGEWMKNWEERMKGYGANVIAEGLIINLTPEEDGLNKCKQLGENLARY